MLKNRRLSSSSSNSQGPSLGEVRSGQVVLKVGHRGEAVAHLQKLLRLTDGNHYSASTIQAVIAFQSRQGLTANGLVDRLTLQRLEQFAASKRSSQELDEKANDPAALQDIALAERKRLQVVTTTLGSFSYLEGSMAISPSESTSVLPQGFSLFLNKADVSKTLRKKYELAAAKVIKATKLSGGYALPLHSSMSMFLDFAKMGLRKADQKTAPKGPCLHRFTHFALPSGSPAMLIEEFGTFDEVKAGQQRVEDGKKKFQKCQFQWDLAWTSQWTDVAARTLAEQAVYRAVSLIPEPTLVLLQGVKFTSLELGDGVASYDYSNHLVTIYRLAISLGELRYGIPDGRGVHDNLTQAVVHELGHAIDLRVFRESKKKEDEIGNALKQSWDDYSRQKASYDSYRASQEEAIKKLTGAARNKKVEELNQRTAELSAVSKGYDSQKLKAAADKQSLRMAAISESGFQRHLEGNTLTQRQVGGTPFLEAIEQDGGVSITQYGETTEKELFAECYCLFLTDSDRFQALRPATFEYLEKAFGR